MNAVIDSLLAGLLPNDYFKVQKPESLSNSRPNSHVVIALVSLLYKKILSHDPEDIGLISAMFSKPDSWETIADRDTSNEKLPALPNYIFLKIFSLIRKSLLKNFMHSDPYADLGYPEEYEQELSGCGEWQDSDFNGNEINLNEDLDEGCIVDSESEIDNSEHDIDASEEYYDYEDTDEGYEEGDFDAQISTTYDQASDDPNSDLADVFFSLLEAICHEYNIDCDGELDFEEPDYSFDPEELEDILSLLKEVVIVKPVQVQNNFL